MAIEGTASSASAETVEAFVADLGNRLDRDEATQVISYLEGLVAQGLPESLLSEARDLVESEQAKAAASFAPDFDGLREALKKWYAETFSGDKFRPDPQYVATVKTLEVPVLLLAAPDVAEATVKWVQKTAHSKKKSFEFTVKGVGIGHSRTLTLEKGITSECSAGQAIRLYRRVPVLVTPMLRIPQSGEPQRFTSVQAIEGFGEDHQEGWRTTHIDPVALNGLSHPASEYFAKAGAPLTFEDTAEAVTASSFQIELEDLGAKVGVEVSATESWQVESHMPGGHDYQTRTPDQGLGLIWKLKE